MRKIFFMAAVVFLSLFSIANATPTAFSILYPTSESLVTDNAFGWSWSSPDVEYDLYIDNAFAAMTHASSITFESTIADGRHSVFVRAIANDNTSIDTSTKYFFINTTGPTFEILADGTSIAVNDTIRSLPKFSINIYDPTGINTGSIVIKLDGAIITPTLTTLSSVDSSTPGVTYTTAINAKFSVTSPLDKGSHIFYVSSSDIFGQISITTISPLNVFGTVNLSGVCKNYPNPFKPLQGETTKIAYTLTEDGNTSILIYDASGNPVKKFTTLAGAETSPNLGLGGRAGYNEVEWNGKSDFGTTVGNGVYPYFLLFGGKIMGTGQLVVYD